MNTQEAFEYSVKHLAKQGGPSLKSGGCLYRGPDNRQCAIGWLIPDNLYEAEFEDLDLDEIQTRLEDSKIFEGLTLGFLSDLQAAHDRFYTTAFGISVHPVPWNSSFKDAFKQVGGWHNLETGFIDELEIRT